MDAFQTAVEDARQRLARAEGRPISVQEMLRRAGFSDEKSGDRLTLRGARFHVDAKEYERRRRPGRGHTVPPELVDALAEVLPISRAELQRAAQVAAGFDVVEQAPTDDVAATVARFLGDPTVSEQERAAVTAELLRIIAEQQTRRHSPEN